MSPKLHRRTPSSAHTYRLLIFKELQNSLAFALLFVACKSFCLQQQRSGIMCCFAIFVKHFVLTFFASHRCRIVLFVSSKEARLCGVLRFSSSTTFDFFSLLRRWRIVLSVNRRARDYGALPTSRQLLAPKKFSSFRFGPPGNPPVFPPLFRKLDSFLRTSSRREANYIKGHGSLASVSQEMLSCPLSDLR